MPGKIKNDRRSQLKQKFLETRFEGFSDREKLELILFYVFPKINADEAAGKLLDKFINLGGVFDANIENLKEVSEINDLAAFLLKLIPELSKDYINTKDKMLIMDNFKTACDYFKNQFIGEKNEIIKIACLDHKLKLINCSSIAEGTPSSAFVNIKKLIEFTYKNNCESIIMIHNHPNGELIPSDEDIKATRNIYNYLKPLGIKLIDHIIVAGGQAISLKESGDFKFI